MAILKFPAKFTFQHNYLYCLSICENEVQALQCFLARNPVESLTIFGLQYSPFYRNGIVALKDRSSFMVQRI